MKKKEILPVHKNTQKTLVDDVFYRLKEDIINGTIPQGSKIIETSLAAIYGTSRGPLREAIRKLEGTHLIKRTPHAGARVVTLNQNMMQDIYITREALEGMSARIVATQCKTETIKSLWSVLAYHEKILNQNNGEQYLKQKGDLDFHHQIALASNNEWIIRFIGTRLYDVLRMCRYQSPMIKERPSQALKEHKTILTAIEQGDPELAELMMRRHISHSWLLLKQHLPTNTLI